MRLLLLVIAASSLVSCKKLVEKAIGPVIVIQASETLEDGYRRTYPLQDGIYEIAVAGSGGLDVSLAGSACPSTHELSTYRQTCDIAGVGTLTVLNPSLLGLGSSVSYAVTVTKIPR